MKSNISSNLSDPSRPVDNRYIHISGAFAVGGAFTRVGTQKVFVPIPSVASVELPMTGGLSTAKSPRWSLGLRKTKLMSIAGATVTCKSKHVAPNDPKGSSVNVDVKGVNVEGVFRLKRALLNLESEHAPGNRYPSIKFGATSIEGMVLGKLKVTVELDLRAFNTFPTADTLESALLSGDKSISPGVLNSFLRNSDGSLHRSQGGYSLGSIVKKITGVPREWIEENGYTIVWPGFGKVILGEILISPSVRRVTLVRLKHCDIEIGGGCDGGSGWP